MSGTLNKVMLIGHLGDEVKMHYFDGGNCIGRFPIATNETYTNKQTGEKITNTEWHNIVLRNKAAEICEKYLSKGDKIYVEGRLKTRQWQGEDGNNRYTTEIHVQDCTLLSTKNESSENNTQATPASRQSTATSRPNAPGEAQTVSEPEQEDDLPF
jgi:single-strand DNA-binding protein